MKYCPQCKAEYLDHITVCADCNETLISREEFEKRQKEEERFHEETKTLVKVFILKDRFEADLVTQALEKENIPLMVRSFKDTAYDGIYIPQKGWGEVRVPEKERVRAQEIIATLEHFLEEGKVGLSEGENVVSCPYCDGEILPESRVCPHCRRVLDVDHEEGYSD